ncbi:MAG: BatD family protein [Planctomycetota bacterium]|nr:BatD family protein [Planctomycetota bacterium]MDP7249448.1 BatD family protein [Planctomycetota bacterium]
MSKICIVYRTTRRVLRVRVLALVPLLLTTAHAGPQFVINQSVSELRAGQTCKIVINVTWEGDATQCLMGEMKCDLPADIERLDAQPASSDFSITAGKPKSTYTYQSLFRPLKAGDFELDKIEVQFKLPTTKPGEWETWTPKSPIKLIASRPLELSGSVITTLAVIGGIAALALAIFGITVWRYKRSAKSDEQADIESPFLERLDDLRSLRIKGDFKDFFAQLSDLLKEYIKQKYSLKSDSDFVITETLDKHIDSTLSKRIREVLELAENVRFGGTPPLPTDLDRAHRSVKDLLELNRPQQTNPEEEISFKET